MSDASDFDAQRRWSAELERDRVAGTIMAPALPYPGPGAVAGNGAAMGAMRDAAVGDESGLAGKAKGVAADAAIAYATGPKGWFDFAMRHKMIVLIALCLVAIQMIMSLMPILILAACISGKECLVDLAWKSVLDYIFGK